MEKLSRENVVPLEQYAVMRAEFKKEVLAHKKNRRLPLGEHATLYFEDTLTMRYQAQEILRIEKVFEPDQIAEELEAYNPLIPDGSNWKATFMLEYEDIDERKAALEKLIGIEDRVWVKVSGFDPVYAIADEDMDRETEEKTSAVHFLRFELDAEMIKAAQNGAEIGAGIDHPEYRQKIDNLPVNIRDSLAQDLS